MTKSRKHQSAPGAPDETGNVSSAENSEPAHTWTDEEMAASKPIPLPTVESTPPQVVGVAGVPHVGKGETKAGGRPENDEEQC
jgi:hypothetical protein